MRHPWLITLCALSLPCWLATGAAAQTRARASSGSSGGSVLRLVSGVQGLDSQPDAVAEDAAPMEAPFGVPQEESTSPHWVSPYDIEGGLNENCATSRHPLPGIVPSLRGPRTPEQFRSQGLGEPLRGASWNNRPLSAGWFVGGVEGDPLIRNHVDQNVGFFGGYRVGWDYDYYWGLETRVGAAAIGLQDLTRPTLPRTGDLVLWDADLLYYPWGDSRWRPYFMVGAGVSVFHFSDDFNNHFRRALFGLPLGIGLKYRVHEFLVARLDLVDNLAIAAGPFDTMNNLSLTVGVEVRFGGTRTHYWPWSPGRHLW